MIRILFIGLSFFAASCSVYRDNWIEMTDAEIEIKLREINEQLQNIKSDLEEGKNVRANSYRYDRSPSADY